MDVNELARTLTKAQRLIVIQEFLGEVVPGIRTLQCVLQDAEDPSNTAYLAVAALGRLGWITEQSLVVAGCDYCPIVGSADAWLIGYNSALQAACTPVAPDTAAAGGRRQKKSPASNAGGASR